MLKLARAEFVLYEAQQNCPISQKECTKDIGGGWDLDKYKFLNMIVRTWEMRPNRKWYVFAEGDTYIVWSNLVQWLREKADPQENLYVGSVAFIANLPFAHGGSGYVMSGVLVKKLIEEIPNLGSKYDELAPKTCCGDGLLSQAIDDVGVSVKQAHPMFNGEKPNTLPFGPTHWCQPLFTMHHMNSEEISSVWQYEQTRTKTVSLSAEQASPTTNKRRILFNFETFTKPFLPRTSCPDVKIGTILPTTHVISVLKKKTKPRPAART
jgi:hypothetical protein